MRFCLLEIFVFKMILLRWLILRVSIFDLSNFWRDHRRESPRQLWNCLYNFIYCSDRVCDLKVYRFQIRVFLYEICMWLVGLKPQTVVYEFLLRHKLFSYCFGWIFLMINQRNEWIDLVNDWFQRMFQVVDHHVDKVFIGLLFQL